MGFEIIDTAFNAKYMLLKCTKKEFDKFEPDNKPTALLFIHENKIYESDDFDNIEIFGMGYLLKTGNLTVVAIEVETGNIITINNLREVNKYFRKNIVDNCKELRENGLDFDPTIDTHEI